MVDAVGEQHPTFSGLPWSFGINQIQIQGCDYGSRVRARTRTSL
jgi:hypothetical protein